MTITKILVANRGEIARRVFTTAKRLGIGTVAVYSDADAGLPFVAEADLAVRLPGSTPAETYLRGDLIIEAARRSGADAIHPGYGFLSESAGFARAVLAAGLTWIGPTPDSIDKMGSKIAAKELMAAAGVPVFGQIDPASATEADLPLLVKASAGGGGRGMRIVRDLADLAGQVELASTEAASAFGDATVFCEPYLENGRHVEVQVLGDTHGNVVILGERDCSLQRRHQKVVEEAPAPLLSDTVRDRLHEGARLAAQAIGYVGAGTVEFMVSTSTGSGQATSSTSGGGEAKISFLEMNTRLQVEHPVTEAVFGIDLVEAQIRVAEGGPVPSAPTDPRGHAVEVRLYAEDPAADYQPQSGVLDTFEIPADLAFEQFLTYGSRLDSGFVSGSEVSTHYDAMLAKVIVWGPDRDSAFRTLAGVLERARIHGLVTNRDLLIRLLRDEKVLGGEVSTDFLGSFDLVGRPTATASAAKAAVVAAAELDRAERQVQQGIPVAWRNVVSQPQRTVLAPLAGGEDIEVLWYGGRTGYGFTDDTAVVSASPEQVVLEVDGVRVAHAVRIVGPQIHVDSGLGSASYRVLPRFVDPAEQVSAGSLLAPMPGTVIAVQAASGDAVEAGQTLLVLEAMKMQHSITAPGDGVVEIAVAVGQQVAAGDVLAVVASEESAPSTTNEESA
ncbi:MAG TPA: biotin carboxylase N-terminal domain-containing protein [Marmoricola sp.]|jgi:propionyl-CoA carboxylase alpha chain|nr:biotin carboxylase N-terminal domain-containing protein [Marmoricola sp.]